MSGRAHVLFVSHEGTLTGAPMALLHLVRWLRDNSTIAPEIAILRDGPLSAEFAEVGPTTVLGSEVGWPYPTDAERELIDKGRVDRALRRQVARMRDVVTPISGADAVYLNSSASFRLLPHLPAAQTVVAHVHELRSAMTWSLAPGDLDEVHRRVDHVIAAADCVAANAIRQLAIAPERVTRIYEFIDPAQIAAPPSRDRAAIRHEMGVGPDDLVVGGSGWADWRKGIDLFVQLGHEISRAGRGDVHLVWVGGIPEGEQGEQIHFDLARSGAADRIHLVGLQSDPHAWYRAFDVLALTSREDPYPLVGLETSLLGIPMACFDGSGGMTELLRRSEEEGRGESGVIVPYLDVEAMAAAVLSLLDDGARRTTMGGIAAETVARDHSVEVAGPQVLDVIERSIAAGSGRL